MREALDEYLERGVHMHEAQLREGARRDAEALECARQLSLAQLGGEKGLQQR